MTRFENVGVFIREKVWLENSLSQGHTTFRRRRKFEIKKTFASAGNRILIRHLYCQYFIDYIT